MYKKFSLLALPLIISGCISLDPDYNRPSNVVSQQFPSGGEVYPVLDSSQSIILQWDEYIQNQKLKQVIAISLNNNKDLKIALANIESAKAQYGITKSSSLPTINGDINAYKGKTLQGQTEGYDANIGLASFELDFFGRVKSLSSSSLETFLSTTEAKKTTTLTVISETSKAYFNIALNKSKLKIAQKTLDASKESLDIIQKRVNSGIASDIDLSNAYTIFYKADADIAYYKTLVEQNKNALNLLTGTNINNSLLPDSFDDLNDSIKAPKLSLSSEILLSRPDILMAEHQLKSANANIGAARAAFFPRISLTTSTGIASSELSSLFKNGHGIWNFSPSISIPIFDNGYNLSYLNYSKAEKEKYIQTYEQSIQIAFREVSDALARKGTIKSQINSYKNLVSESNKSFNLSNAAYKEGIYNYLDVLTAQRSLYDVETQFLDLQKEEFDNLITLYKVTGNGF